MAEKQKTSLRGICEENPWKLYYTKTKGEITENIYFWIMAGAAGTFLKFITKQDGKIVNSQVVYLERKLGITKMPNAKGTYLTA